MLESKAISRGRLSQHFIGIDHLAIAVEDLSSALEWYCGVLGLELVDRRMTEGVRTGMVSAVVKGGGLTIVLVQGTSASSQVSRFIERFGPGVHHIAIGVKDFSGVCGALRESGESFDVGPLMDTGITQAFMSRHPANSVRFELIEQRGSAFSDKNVRELFLAFEEKDLV